MIPAADFFGELFGPNWTAQEVATVIVALIALLGAAANILVTLHQGRKARALSEKHHEIDHEEQERMRAIAEFEARLQQWHLFGELTLKLVSGSPMEQKAAIHAMQDIALDKQAEVDLRRITIEILGSYTGRALDEVKEEGT